MEITEVRIKLMEDTEDRLRAFCSITFDNCFVVRDLKIIEGNSGAFVAMPSRKLMQHCPKCGTKNHLRAKHCNNCGGRTSSQEIATDGHGRAKLYADIAHPINAVCREMIQNRVIEEFDIEQERSQQPGYISKYDEAYDTLDDDITGIPDPTAIQTGNVNKGGAQQGQSRDSESGSTKEEVIENQPVGSENHTRVDTKHPGAESPHQTNDQVDPKADSSQTDHRGDSGGDFGEGIFE